MTICTLYPTLNAKTGKPITFDEIKRMAATPQATAKLETELITPTDAPGKSKDIVMKHNRMTVGWVDIDSGNQSLSEVVDKCKEFGFDEAIIYSSSFAKRIKNGVMQGHRWRVIINLAVALDCEHWEYLQQALAIIFVGGSEAVRIHQGMFAPTNPDNGYYEYQIINGQPLDPSHLPKNVLEVVEQIIRQEAALQEAVVDAPTKTRIASDACSSDIIGKVNQAYEMADVLKDLGYIRKAKNKWLHPKSTSGAAGVVILNNKYFSHHQSDPLSDGHTHDVFDILKLWKFNGDEKAAIAFYAEELDPEGQRQRRLKFKKAQGSTDPHEWTEPQPLGVKVAAESYPLDALPPTVQAAVKEVASFVKAPFPLVASSALGALSLAIQPHVDAKREEGLEGPVSLFLLTIADSGERKSTCDSFFTKAIRAYEEAQAEAAKPEIKRHAAEIAAWTAEREGLLSAIKVAGKTRKQTDSLRTVLEGLEHRKPKPPRIPRLLYTDATPEALAFGLAKQWPSGAVISAEAGTVFGAHGMGQDSVMRNLTLLNVLWDGGTLTIDRRTAESFTVREAKLTMALQVQEATLRSFFDRSGTLARGTGFLARFLVAWPESTQGFRLFTEPPTAWPALEEFNRRITANMEHPTTIDENGKLTPPVMQFTPEAKRAWVAFHNAIERKLASGGELYDVRDVASKSADNAARLAALFQVFETGMGGAINAEAFESASRIAAWHLNEARRFFGEFALPKELADAVRLDAWLIEYCKREGTKLVPTKQVQQFGPGGLREKAAIENALRELEEANRARLVHEGKRRIIHINPALVNEMAE